MEKDEQKKDEHLAKRPRRVLRISLIALAQWQILHSLIRGRHPQSPSHLGLPESPREVCQRAGLKFTASLVFYFSEEAALFPPPGPIFFRLQKAVGLEFHLSTPGVWSVGVSLLVGEARTSEFKSMPLRKKVDRAVALLFRSSSRYTIHPVPDRITKVDDAERFANFYSVVLCDNLDLMSMRLIDARTPSPESLGVETGQRTLEMDFAKEKVSESEARALLQRYRDQCPFDLTAVKIDAIGTVPLHFFLPPVQIAVEVEDSQQQEGAADAPDKKDSAPEDSKQEGTADSPDKKPKQKAKKVSRGTLGGFVRSADGRSYGITAHHVVFPKGEADNEGDSPSKMKGEEQKKATELKPDEKGKEKDEDVEGEGGEDEQNEEDPLIVDIEDEAVDVWAYYTQPTAADIAYPFTKRNQPFESLLRRFLGCAISMKPLRRRDLAPVELHGALPFTVGAILAPVGAFVMFQGLEDMESLLGSTVSKYGCTTSYTEGIITDVDITAGTATIEPRKPHRSFAEEGDSGSLCVTTQGRLVGVVSCKRGDGKVVVQMLAEADLELV